MYEVVYFAEEYGFYPVPNQYYSGFSLSFNNIQIELSLDGWAEFPWGYTPRARWEHFELAPPQALPGELLVTSDEGIPRGMSIRMSRERIPEYYNRQNGWYCIGDPAEEGEFCISLVPSVILVGTPTRISAIWVKISRTE